MTIEKAETYTLYAFQYTDGEIEYSFGKLRNQQDKDIKRYLIETMSLEKKRSLESLDAEHTYDIVKTLLDVNGHRGENLRLNQL